jgi:hypothetical protein
VTPDAAIQGLLRIIFWNTIAAETYFVHIVENVQCSAKMIFLLILACCGDNQSSGTDSALFTVAAEKRKVSHPSFSSFFESDNRDSVA